MFAKSAKHKTKPKTTAKKEKFIGCTLMELPTAQQIEGAKEAIRINPVNAPARALRPILGEPNEAAQSRQAMETQKKWSASGVRLSVGFFGQPRNELRVRILSHMNAWNEFCSISFVDVPDVSSAQVRISLGNGGYWSYLGTDILQIPRNQQTMNLQGFSLNSSESECRRVIRHETGHTLGMPHEHMLPEIINRLDAQKTIRYFKQTQGWTEQEVIQQVLTPLRADDIIGSPADERAIMCYQLPGSITKDGKPIPGGEDINPNDAAFVARIYPKAQQPVVPPPTGGSVVDTVVGYFGGKEVFRVGTGSVKVTTV